MDVLVSNNQIFSFLEKFGVDRYKKDPVYLKGSGDTNSVLMDFVLTREVTNRTYDPVHCVRSIAGLVDRSFEVSFLVEAALPYLSLLEEDRMLMLKFPDKMEDTGTIDMGWFDDDVFDVVGQVDFEKTDFDMPAENLPKVSKEYGISYDDMGTVRYDIPDKETFFQFSLFEAGSVPELNEVVGSIVANYEEKKGDTYMTNGVARRGRKRKAVADVEVVETEAAAPEEPVDEKPPVTGEPEVKKAAAKGVEKAARKPRRTPEQILQEKVVHLESLGYSVSKQDEDAEEVTLASLKAKFEHSVNTMTACVDKMCSLVECVPQEKPEVLTELASILEKYQK